MSKSTKPRPPAGISDEACESFEELLSAFRSPPSAVQLATLERITLARDRLGRIRATLAREGETVKGSKGQPRPHPLLAVEAQLRAEISDGLGKLSHRLEG